MQKKLITRQINKYPWTPKHITRTTNFIDQRKSGSWNKETYGLFISSMKGLYKFSLPFYAIVMQIRSIIRLLFLSLGHY